jgi:5-methylcytosine-specific restriction protein A
MTPSENEQFTKMLRDAAEECSRIGYRPTKFLQMLNADGGYATAARLLAAPNISDGFAELQMRGKLNLTVEALVLEKGWADHFDPALINQAKKRLQAARYTPQLATGHGSRGVVATPRSNGSLPISDGADGVALSGGLLRVLQGYLEAAKEPFSKHPMADFIRGKLADQVAILVEEYAPNFEVKGSSGQGVWARGPWVGIFDPLVTTGAQNGYYVCYLFKEDMSGVYLSLNQGMTEAKEHYKSGAKAALVARAHNFRAMLGDEISSDLLSDIDLVPSSPSAATAFYEKGNICAVYYSARSMPDEQTVRKDLLDMVALYRALIEAQFNMDSSLDDEGDLAPASMLEDGTKFRLHKRIERNASLVKLVKQSKPSSCEVCGLDLGERYGAIGSGYIEAHHLRPVSSLKGTKVELDPVRDFAVLCPNCHRMVHKSGLIDDLERFKKEHYRG